jgi:molybdopterin synthase sulfur carrier subunit
MSSTVRVLAFAGARDIIGAGELAWEVEGPCTTGELLAEVCNRFPALAPYARSIRMAVNGCYTEPGHPVIAGDEVALIPPVAGG